MNITVAKTAGFCFGVRRAVDLVHTALDEGKRICTLGPLIHNPQVIESLMRRGVDIIENVENCGKDDCVVLRSHGVGKHVYDTLKRRKIEYIDATCPFVEKIHRLVGEKSEQGFHVLIAGDKSHPEVQGIVGHVSRGVDCRTFSDAEEFDELLKIRSFFVEKSYILVAQTTFNVLEWKKCVSVAENLYTNLTIFDTICSATTLRQKEAAELAKKSDLMVVVGGAGSSNTAKLVQVCENFCRTIAVERPKTLAVHDFSAVSSIGITAGASTPGSIIREVRKVMDEMLNVQDEMSFEEMLEGSFKTINSREKVTAIVTGISPTEVSVDIGTKQAGYVPLDELTDDPNVDIRDLVKIGDELELIVLRVSDIDGIATLSKKRLDAIAGFEKIAEAAETDQIFEGVVTEVIKGGVLASTSGVRVFIPASQATTDRNQELESLMKCTVQFRILEVNRQRRRAVGSIRSVLRDQRKIQEEAFWTSAEVGKVYKGTVKSLTSYGAFVDLGGVDGMVHVSELSWSRVKHPSEVVKIGDLLEVYIRELDTEKKKISLGYKKNEDNPWEVLKDQYAIGDTAEVTVVSVTPFGAFAQLIPGVDGLIHISQLSTERVAKPADVISVGQAVTVKITDIDFDKKRLSLSMRALLEDAAAEQAAEEAEAAPITYEAAPPEA